MAWYGGAAPPREPTMQEVLGAFMATITQANADANARGAIDAQRTNDLMQFMMQLQISLKIKHQGLFLIQPK